MSEDKKTGEKLVSVMIPKLRDGSEEVQFASVNGRDFLIQRGKRVEVPESLAEVLNHSAQALDSLDELIASNAK